VPSTDYFNQLANAAQEWSKKQPDDATGLARRLLEFRQGCSTLILAEHRPLSPEDRRWLVKNCQEWAQEIDHELTDLEAGKNPAEIRRRADATVRQLVDALQKKARES
jgi:hypothetical protein